MKALRKLRKQLAAPPGRRIRLKDHDPDWTASITDEDHAEALLADGVRRLARQQDVLYAENTRCLLLIFQAMDAAGKDGTIRHVMSGVNPQGCQVFSFKAPSAEERDHTYLWRSMKALPERGRIGIHNRSYYEEVVVTRVHKALLDAQQLPAHLKDKGIWRRRFREINDFERYLTGNGVVVLKFFLHVSKREQKERLLARIDESDKNWKMSVHDVAERAHWDAYMDAYEDVFTHTSTETAPWYIVPADHKWFTRLAVAEIISATLEDLDLQYPQVSAAQRAELLEARRTLMSEAD